MSSTLWNNCRFKNCLELACGKEKFFRAWNHMLGFACCCWFDASIPWGVFYYLVSRPSSDAYFSAEIWIYIHTVHDAMPLNLGTVEFLMLVDFLLSMSKPYIQKTRYLLSLLYRNHWSVTPSNIFSVHVVFLVLTFSHKIKLIFLFITYSVNFHLYHITPQYSGFPWWLNW